MGSDNTSMEIAAWLQGVGTVAAVVVALFLQPFLVWLRRPRVSLEVALDGATQDLHTAVKEEYDHSICWLRGRVLVKGGRDAAANVEVMVQGWNSPAPQNAPFAHDNYLSWSNGMDDLIRIPAGVWSRGRSHPVDGLFGRRQRAHIVARCPQGNWLPTEAVVASQRGRLLLL